MIVSQDLGFFTIAPRKYKKNQSMIAPQRQVGQVDNDFGSSSDDEPFTTPSQTAGIPYCPNPRSFMRRKRNNAVNASRPEGMYNNVPLKSMQEFSHAEGAALFNADTPAYMRRLPIREDRPREIFLTAYEDELDVPFERMLEYNMGIRPDIRSLPGQKAIPEPVGAVYRPNTRPAPERVAPTDYDIGDDELKQMMKVKF